jgi:hypothetical protein
MRRKLKRRKRPFKPYISSLELEHAICGPCKMEVMYEYCDVFLSSQFDMDFFRCEISDLNKYINALSQASELTINAMEVNFEYTKLLTKLKNIKDLRLKCEATDENITALNRIIANNAENLKLIALTCEGDSSTYSLDLTPLKDAEKLNILTIKCDADVTGINSLPDNIEYVYLQTEHKQPIDLSALPHNAWFISVNGSVVCTDKRAVYTKTSTMGILKSNITDDIVECIPNMFPNLTVVSLGGSQKVTNVSALAKNKLYMLFVNGTSVGDANQFANFDNLQYIDISNTLIDSVQPLYKLPKLAVIVTISSTKLFNDQVTSFERMRSEKLPLIINNEMSRGKRMYPSNKLVRYLTEKLGNDRNCLRYMDNCRFAHDSNDFIVPYKHYKFIELTNINAAFGVGEGTIDTIYGAAAFERVPDFINVKKISLTYPVDKYLLAMPETARLEYFSANIELRDLEMIRKKSVILSDLESLRLSDADNDDISLSELDFLINDKLKHVEITGFNIKSGDSFYTLPNAETIFIASAKKTEISFDLDAMPDLRKIELYNVIPHFKISHKHNNLKNIYITEADLSSIDDIFDDTEATQAISPKRLDFTKNRLESLKSNLIDLSTVKSLNVHDNWLADEAINIGDFNSLEYLYAYQNLLTESKEEEIREFNRNNEKISTTDVNPGITLPS